MHDCPSLESYKMAILTFIWKIPRLVTNLMAHKSRRAVNKGVTHNTCYVLLSMFDGSFMLGVNLPTAVDTFAKWVLRSRLQVDQNLMTTLIQLKIFLLVLPVLSIMFQYFTIVFSFLSYFFSLASLLSYRYVVFCHFRDVNRENNSSLVIHII